MYYSWFNGIGRNIDCELLTNVTNKKFKIKIYFKVVIVNVSIISYAVGLDLMSGVKFDVWRQADVLIHHTKVQRCIIS